ncbi:MAG: hypothetical protein Q9225_002696 [Loekoesia sp. 1 TL-2023]
MATGMPAWVTRTLEFLTHPRDSSVRSTFEQPQRSERLVPARRKSPPRAGVGVERRKINSRHSRSQAHISRFPINVSNSETLEITQTYDRAGTYENRSTQTDETISVHASLSKSVEDPPDSVARELRQADNPPSLWYDDPAQAPHSTKSVYEYGSMLEESFEPLADSNDGGVPRRLPNNGTADEHMGFEEANADDRRYTGRGSETVVQDVEMSDGPPYTDGEAQVVLANDGRQNCLELLLTSDMVAKINQIATRSRRLEFITRRLKQAKREIASEENMIDYKTDALQDTDDQAEIARIHEEIDKIQKRIVEATKCINTLEEEIDTLTINLAYSREQSQEIFEDVLGRMDLLDVPEPEFAKEVDPAGEPDFGAEPAWVEEEVDTPGRKHGDEAPVSERLDEANRRTARDDFEHRRNILITMDEAFEHRQENLAEEKAEYRRRVREGTCHITQTEFDLLALEDFRKMTADLRDAQEAFEESFKRAKQLGVLDERDAHYQESVFSEWSGGYPLSLESAMRGSAPTKNITHWQESMEKSGNETLWGGTGLEPWGNPDLEPEAQKLDDCDIKSVAISDSWSCVDWSRNRRRIDQWREIAGRER